jgi:hypothetical protein
VQADAFVLVPTEMRRLFCSFARPLTLGLCLAGGGALGFSGALGCSGAQGGGSSGSEGLPAWEGEVRRAFSDDIDPAAVGLTLAGPEPRADGFLRHRAQTADVVARVRVQTVTIDTIGQTTTYHLGVQVGYPALTPPKIEERSFELVIGPTSPAYPVAKAFDTRLRGMTFVGFIKHFAGEGGEPAVHWHLSPDTADVAAAVQEAVALQEIAGS